MSTRHNPPRQHRPHAKRTPVVRHASNRGVGTERKSLPAAYGMLPSAPTVPQQAGMYYARKANRAGRPPLK
jgi:hypothetical protein